MDIVSYWPRWELCHVDRNDAWWLEAHLGRYDGKPHQLPTHSHSGVRSEGRFSLTRNPRTILSLRVHVCAATWYSDWGYTSDYSRFLADQWLLIWHLQTQFNAIKHNQMYSFVSFMNKRIQLYKQSKTYRAKLWQLRVARSLLQSPELFYQADSFAASHLVFPGIYRAQSPAKMTRRS